jgi:Asp-tRNA(Asn)/Glu-tRNA(Gln) amidotransferase A subunit family amidase
MSADGLPIGVQLVGRPYEEELILELAVRLENARGPVAHALLRAASPLMGTPASGVPRAQ